jgi:hypothetical protein
LLKINPNPTVDDSMIASSSERIGNEQLPIWLVRINMRQMVQLKERGYIVLGPVNGPNEGLPEFEVLEDWLNSLSAERPSMLIEVRSGPHSQPQPIIHPTDNQIDPLLWPQQQEPDATTAPAKAAATLPNRADGLIH